MREATEVEPVLLNGQITVKVLFFGGGGAYYCWKLYVCTQKWFSLYLEGLLKNEGFCIWKSCTRRNVGTR